ncbi:hypothetical protein BOX15_Mlig001622g5, partial [Macrostomum lignano]
LNLLPPLANLCLACTVKIVLREMMKLLFETRIIFSTWIFAFIFLQCHVKGSLFDFVTCGSVLKLQNLAHNVRLHSHEVRYGSGSGQQSVTGVEATEDANSYWRVRDATSGTGCRRGDPVRCGDTLRLTHLATGKNLHSHLYSSPITQEQEVSAYGDAKGEGDRGDDWTVVCDTSGGGGGGGLWLRSQRVRLRHSVTERYLHVAGARFGRPIAGQAEVSAVASGGGRGSYWLAAEGVFVKPNEASESPGMGRAPSVERPAFVVSGDGADGGGLHDSGEL